MVYYLYLSTANPYQLGKKAFILHDNRKYENFTKVNLIERHWAPAIELSARVGYISTNPLESINVHL